MKQSIAIRIGLLSLCIVVGWAPGLAIAEQEKSTTAAQETKGKTCRMEQQCHWENFKKICTYVKVCR